MIQFLDELSSSKRSNDSLGSRLTTLGLRSMHEKEHSNDLDRWSPHCFTVSFTGRLGNFMFQYAALVGLCISKGLSTETCASISQSATERDVSLLNEFATTFQIPAISCPLYEKFLQEHKESPFGTFFDP